MYREMLKSLDAHEGDEPFFLECLYGKLRQLLRERGESYLPNIEIALRHSIKTYSWVLPEMTQINNFCITYFENLKGCFIDLQSLFYDIYLQVQVDNTPHS